MTGFQIEGTVRAVSIEARTLEVITAVGHAVRVVPLTVAEDCTVVVQGTPSKLANVTPGTIVRVAYITAPVAVARPLAVTIETIPVNGTGGVR